MSTTINSIGHSVAEVNCLRPADRATSPGGGDITRSHLQVVHKEVKSSAPGPRPFVEQYIALPPDTLDVFRASHGYDRSVDPKDRKSGKGRKDRLTNKHLWLLAALYRLANKQNSLVIVELDVLAAASGWSSEALRKELTRPLLPWVYYAEQVPGTLQWKINLKGVSDTDFLKVMAWWLWREPEGGADGADRFVRRDWNASSAALLTVLAVSRVGRGFVETETYGYTGLATIAGVSVSTMEKGRRDADRLGILAITNRQGGEKAAHLRVRLHPTDPISEFPPDWYPDNKASGVGPRPRGGLF